MANILKSSKHTISLIIFLIYWVIQSLILYTVQGVGFTPQIASFLLILLCLLRLLIRNKTYNILFAVLLFIYSLFEGVLALILFSFFDQTLEYKVIACFIFIINIAIAFSMFVIARKEI